MAKTNETKTTPKAAVEKYKAPQGLTVWDGDEYNRHLAKSQRARGERVNVPEFRISKGYRHSQEEPEEVQPNPRSGSQNHVERTEGGATIGIEGGEKGLDLSEFGGGDAGGDE